MAHFSNFMAAAAAAAAAQRYTTTVTRIDFPLVTARTIVIGATPPAAAAAATGTGAASGGPRKPSGVTITHDEGSHSKFGDIDVKGNLAINAHSDAANPKNTTASYGTINCDGAFTLNATPNTYPPFGKPPKSDINSWIGKDDPDMSEVLKLWSAITSVKTADGQVGGAEVWVWWIDQMEWRRGVVHLAWEATTDVKKPGYYMHVRYLAPHTAEIPEEFNLLWRSVFERVRMA